MPSADVIVLVPHAPEDLHGQAKEHDQGERPAASRDDRHRVSGFFFFSPFTFTQEDGTIGRSDALT